MNGTRTFYLGSKEYLVLTVTANVDLDQAAQITFNRKDWYDTDWLGLLDTTRQLRYLLDLTPSGLDLSQGVHTVFIRLTDTPEIPYIKAGQIKVA